MPVLAYEGSKSNIKNAKYVADTYADLSLIPIEDMVFGTECQVIETGDIWKLNSSLQWVRQLNGQNPGMPSAGDYVDGTGLVADDGDWVASLGGFKVVDEEEVTVTDTSTPVTLTLNSSDLYETNVYINGKPTTFYEVEGEPLIWANEYGAVTFDNSVVSFTGETTGDYTISITEVNPNENRLLPFPDGENGEVLMLSNSEWVIGELPTTNSLELPTTVLRNLAEFFNDSLVENATTIETLLDTPATTITCMRNTGSNLGCASMINVSSYVAVTDTGEFGWQFCNYYFSTSITTGFSNITVNVYSIADGYTLEESFYFSNK